MVAGRQRRSRRAAARFAALLPAPAEAIAWWKDPADPAKPVAAGVDMRVILKLPDDYTRAGLVFRADIDPQDPTDFGDGWTRDFLRVDIGSDGRTGHTDEFRGHNTYLGE